MTDCTSLSTNQRSTALRRNCGLASWEKLELTVQSQLNAVFSFPLTETAGCVMKCGCPERWLPAVCILPDWQHTPASALGLGWRVSVGGVTKFHFLAGWRLTATAGFSFRGECEELQSPSLPLPTAPGRGFVDERSANGQSRVSRREDERPGSFRPVEQIRWRSWADPGLGVREQISFQSLLGEH